jgi:4-alpha-glucanotransferase
MDFTGIYHNSRQKCYRWPFGAVKAGETVRVSIDVPDESMYVRLRLWFDGGERLVEGTREGLTVSFAFQCPHTGLVWYYFILCRDGDMKYYGGSGGEGIVCGNPPCSYQITVYDGAFTTPKWFREGIVYQIFPDRFARPMHSRGGLDRAYAHTEKGRRVYLHENWDTPVLSEPLDDAKTYEPCDFYGGDLKGIEEKLPYLKELGVTCIYVNPIFESPSNHRYNTSDYLKIDPILGDENDLKRLTAKAGEMGIRLMLDGVFSHTGDDSVYFDRRGIYGNGAYRNANSPYRRWYDPENKGEYRYWWGFTSLPEVNELDESYKAFIHTVLLKWAGCGTSSWRLDVADELPDDFIAFFRKELKSIDPEGVLLGEVWDDASNKEGFCARRKFVDGNELDSAMGYPFKNAVFDFLLCRTDAQGLAARLWAIRENYPKPFYDAQLNILGSHDTVRALSELSGAPHRDALTMEEQRLYKSDETQHIRGQKRLMLAVFIQMAVPGVPCIYYGDEAGLEGMADPFCRAPYPWGREDAEILNFYRAITRIRTGSAALKGGACGFAAIRTDVFAVLRCFGRESVLAIVNRSEAPVEVELQAESFFDGPDAEALKLANTYRDALKGGIVHTENGVLKLVLEPLSGAMLLS